MGIKFFNQLHLLPWCFHLARAGGHSFVADDAAADEPPSDPIKLIKCDGHVSVYHRPIHASELMTEFPKHLVCHSDDFYIGRKIPALSEDDQLQLGQKYFLLPKHFFQSVLSFVTIASFMASQPQTAPLSGAVKRAAAKNQLFDVQRTSSGFLRIRVSDEFISKLMEEGKKITEEARDAGEGTGNSRVCTTAQLEKDYEQLVIVSRTRQWKPKLEMIQEGKEKKKKKRGFSNSFGIKRKRSRQSKSPSQSQSSQSQSQSPQCIEKQRKQRSENSTDLVACSSKKLPPLKSRFRMRSRK